MEQLTTFTRKSRIFQNRNYFFFIHCIRLSTVTAVDTNLASVAAMLWNTEA